MKNIKNIVLMNYKKKIKKERKNQSRILNKKSQQNKDQHMFYLIKKNLKKMFMSSIKFRQ